MLQITFVNDGTGTNESANYDYTVSVSGRVIEEGRIEGHNRGFGWMGLMQNLYHQNLDEWKYALGLED